MQLDAIPAFVEASVQVGLDVLPTVRFGTAKGENGDSIGIAFRKECLRVSRIERADQLEIDMLQSVFQLAKESLKNSYQGSGVDGK